MPNGLLGTSGTAGKLERAVIVVVDRIPDKITEIPCMFNPTTFSIKYSAKLNKREVAHWVKGKSGKYEKTMEPKIDYKGPGVTELNVELLFDTTEKRDWIDVAVGTSVKEAFVDKLVILMKPVVLEQSGKIHTIRPPKCIFRWGGLTKIKRDEETYFIENLDVTYQLFDEQATPLRALVKLKFSRELEPKKSQNPTTVSVSRKMHVVEAGQTLDWIAYQEFGDSSYWRDIAELNNLSNPRKLRPGQVLKLPVL
jgi:hypothetical protein